MAQIRELPEDERRMPFDACEVIMETFRKINLHLYEEKEQMQFALSYGTF